MDNSEEDCTRPVMVTSQPTTNYGSRNESAQPRELLPPVLGVSAANIGGYPTVFTPPLAPGCSRVPPPGCR